MTAFPLEILLSTLLWRSLLAGQVTAAGGTFYFALALVMDFFSD